MRIRNFGRNLDFHSKNYFEPNSSEEVLDVLATNRGTRIRTMGRLHSWSQAPVSEDTLLNLKNLNGVKIEQIDGAFFVRVAGGCQIKRLIQKLDEAGLALPSQGLITEQSIAGAISTGTHGSGKSSLSHYVLELQVADYDPASGEPRIRTIQAGEELQAARCALGCLGVILEVKLPCVSQYQVEEHWHFYDELEEAIQGEGEYPIQQFFFLPHSWAFLAQHRKPTEAKKSVLAPLFHLYWFLTVDFGLHVIVLFLSRCFRFGWATSAFYKLLVPWTIITNWKVVDKSQHMLTMEHELFRHIECELFVRRSQLPEFLQCVRSLLSYFHGDETAIGDELWESLRGLKVDSKVRELRGIYSHHYPICVRRIQVDDTLISMASGFMASAPEASGSVASKATANSEGEDYYSVSFISYGKGNARSQFLQAVEVLTTIATEIFDGRPHWGKVCPIDSKTAARIYPNMHRFRDICEEADPDGKFRNDWLQWLIFEDWEERA